MARTLLVSFTTGHIAASFPATHTFGAKERAPKYVRITVSDEVAAGLGDLGEVRVPDGVDGQGLPRFRTVHPHAWAVDFDAIAPQLRERLANDDHVDASDPSVWELVRPAVTRYDGQAAPGQGPPRQPNRGGRKFAEVIEDRRPEIDAWAAWCKSIERIRGAERDAQKASESIADDRRIRAAIEARALSFEADPREVAYLELLTERTAAAEQARQTAVERRAQLVTEETELRHAKNAARAAHRARVR